MNDVLHSIYALAKSNNGTFKSQKQADFLTQYIHSCGGRFESSISLGEEGRTKRVRYVVDVLIDGKGIKEIKHSSKQYWARASDSDFDAAKKEQKQKMINSNRNNLYFKNLDKLEIIRNGICDNFMKALISFRDPKESLDSKEYKALERVTNLIEIKKSKGCPCP